MQDSTLTAFKQIVNNIKVKKLEVGQIWLENLKGVLYLSFILMIKNKSKFLVYNRYYYYQ